jgi:predicted transposase YbfD/YdcC
MKFTLPECERRLREVGAAVFDLDGLCRRLEMIEDWRGARGRRFKLAPLLVLIALAKLSGEDLPSGIADWIRIRGQWLLESLRLDWKATPCENTIRRVWSFGFEPTKLDRSVAEHLTELTTTTTTEESNGKLTDSLISVDGKAVNGTIPTGETRGEYLLAAYLVKSGIVIGQVSVGSKENEIVAAPELLAGLALAGKIVIGDAIHTQRKLSKQIISAKGNFVWIVKKNQAILHQEIVDLFALQTPTVLGNYLPNDFLSYKSSNKGHGRRESRRITVSSELNGYSDWPSLNQVFRIERERIDSRTNQKTSETVYGLTSLRRDQASPKALAELVRAYWGIENGLHYRRDTTFHEDSIRQTIGHAGHVSATLNNLAIGILRHIGFTNIAQARRIFDGLINQPNHLAIGRTIT